MFLSTILIGLLGVSVAVILWLLVLKAGARGGPREEGPSLAARMFAVWVASTVFFKEYFGSVRFFGLFDLTVERACFLALLAVMAARLYRGRVSVRRGGAVEVLIAAFLSLCLVSMSVHGFFPTGAAATDPWFVFLEGYLLPFFAFFCVKYCMGTEADDRCLMKGLFWVGAAVAVISLMEGFGLRQYVLPRYIADPTLGLHLDRARGPLLNAAFSGQVMCVGLVAGLALLPVVRFPGKLWHCALLALFPLAIYFTRTRSVLLQLVLILLAGIAVLRTPFPKWKVLALPVCLAVLLLVANLGRFASSERSAGGLAQMREVSIRFELASKSLRLIGENPFFGVGLAKFRNASLSAPGETEYQHNHLIGLAAELGLVGLSVYLGLLGVIFVRLFRLLRSPPEGRFVNANFLFLLGLVLLCDLTSNTFVEPALMSYAGVNFYLAAGIIDRRYGDLNGPPGGA